MKLLYSSYEQYTALAIAADLGVNYYNSEKDLSFSMVLKNLGGQVKRFTDQYDRLPWDIQLGYTQSLNGGPFRLSITAVNLNRWKLPYYTRQDANDANSPLVLKDNFVGNLFRHLILQWNTLRPTVSTSAWATTIKHEPIWRLSRATSFPAFRQERASAPTNSVSALRLPSRISAERPLWSTCQPVFMNL